MRTLIEAFDQGWRRYYSPDDHGFKLVWSNDGKLSFHTSWQDEVIINQLLPDEGFSPEQIARYVECAQLGMVVIALGSDHTVVAPWIIAERIN